MKMQTKHYEAQLRNFETLPNGVRWEAVIFSSDNNRNEYYFDIYKLLKWKTRLGSVLLNDNHNGKYFSPLTDKVVDIRVETNDNGVTECYAIIESTNKEKRMNPEMVTGFSIEISVDPKNEIKNHNGEYYLDFEWVGIAYLTGKLAGSGGSRLLDMKTFAKNNETLKTYPNILDMDKTELQTILNEALQPILDTITELKAQVEGLVNEEATEASSEAETTTDEVDTAQKEMAAEDTEVITPEGITTEEIIETPTKVVEVTEEVIEVTPVINIQDEVNKAVEFALKQYKITEANDELSAIENSLNNVNNLKSFMANASNEELVTESQTTENATTETTVKKYNKADAVKNLKKLLN